MDAEEKKTEREMLDLVARAKAEEKIPRGATLRQIILDMAATVKGIHERMGDGPRLGAEIQIIRLDLVNLIERLAHIEAAIDRLADEVRHVRPEAA